MLALWRKGKTRIEHARVCSSLMFLFLLRGKMIFVSCHWENAWLVPNPNSGAFACKHFGYNEVIFLKKLLPNQASEMRTLTIMKFESITIKDIGKALGLSTST